MPQPTVDNPSDQQRWFLEALSATTRESVLSHLCAGWLEFTPAMAVLIGQATIGYSFACFLQKGSSPQFFPQLDTKDTNIEDAIDGAVKDKTLNHYQSHPIVSFDWNQETTGWMKTWTETDQLPEECDWLWEASARRLWSEQQLEQRLQSEKLEALGEFAAGAGHEINNPVATISGRVQGLLQTETDLERRRHLLTIGGQALRIRDMIGDTMLFARAPNPDPKRLDLQVVLPKILEGLKSELVNADFASTVSDQVTIFADQVQLAIVITELLRNCLDWQNNGGKIRLSASSIEFKEGPMAQILVDDNGESLSEDAQAHAFDPFYCGRQAGRSLGFGLPKCWRIVSNHHGRIRIASLPLQGTRVTVIWPAYDFRALPQ